MRNTIELQEVAYGTIPHPRKQLEENSPANYAISGANTRPAFDEDPQEEPTVPESKPEERDFLDICLDAQRSIRNASRSDSLFMRKANLLVATSELRLALEKLG